MVLLIMGSVHGRTSLIRLGGSGLSANPAARVKVGL